MRRTHPEVTLTCFAAGADAVQREHGIAATQLMTYRSTSAGSATGRVLKAVSRLWDVPRTFGLMRDVDVLVVPGTGVLATRPEAPPWGLPYWLFLAVLACRLRGRKVALVSVGAEDAKNPVTRRFYRWTVRLSHYCTYRDEESRAAVRSMGLKGRLGGVYPDLAFALPTPTDHAERPGHVVIGVMLYSGSRDDAYRGPDVREAYVDRMVEVVARLLAEERTVTLVIGDEKDRDVAAEIHGLVSRECSDVAPARLSLSPAGTLDEIMRVMARAEVVVASRFHNVVCALKLLKPTISLGYADKNEHLLRQFGLGEFSQPIDAFDVDRLVAQVNEAPDAQAAVEPIMKDTCRRFEDQLSEQSRQFSKLVLSGDAVRAPRVNRITNAPLSHDDRKRSP
jgi:polysaccharide pyruvyl transferase WcaK-like protein